MSDYKVDHFKLQDFLSTVTIVKALKDRSAGDFIKTGCYVCLCLTNVSDLFIEG